MDKYIITSGYSVITKVDEKTFVATNIMDNALQYDSIGEAMRETIKINNLINNNIYKVKLIEIPVSSNL